MFSLLPRRHTNSASKKPHVENPVPGDLVIPQIGTGNESPASGDAHATAIGNVEVRPPIETFKLPSLAREAGDFRPGGAASAPGGDANEVGHCTLDRKPYHVVMTAATGSYQVGDREQVGVTSRRQRV